MTDLSFGNSLEIENEIILNYLRIIVFVDTSLYKKDKNGYDFIISYGPGLILNIMNFNIQAYYGIATDKKIFEGLFYLKLKKIIY